MTVSKAELHGKLLALSDAMAKQSAEPNRAKREAMGQAMIEDACGIVAGVFDDIHRIADALEAIAQTLTAE